MSEIEVSTKRPTGRPRTKPIDLISKGELFEQYNYNTARAWIQKHAKRIYYESARPMHCFFCGYDKHLDLSHRRAVSRFPDSTLCRYINHIDNLVMLCPNHHREADAGEIDLIAARDLELTGYVKAPFVPIPHTQNRGRTRQCSQKGCVVLKTRAKTMGVWMFHFRHDKKQKAILLGRLEDIPTREEAWEMVAKLRKTMPHRFPKNIVD